MRDFGGDITAELAAEIKKIFTCIEFQLESGTEYYTDCDIGLYIPSEVIPSGLSENLVAHYKFNEIGGVTAHDSSGNDYDLTMQNIEATDWGAGIIKGCITLDGAAEYGEVNHTGNIDFTDSDLTITAWVKHGGANDYRSICANGEGQTAVRQFAFIINSGDVLQFWTFDGINWTTRVTSGSDLVVADKWHFVAVVFDDSAETAKLYIDGIEVGSANSLNSMAYSPTYLIVGARYSDEHFDGPIDNLQLYDTALTQAQLNEVYKREYTATDYKLKNMTHTLGMAVDSVTLTFPSAALGWGAQVGNYDIRGTAVIMSNVFLDDNNQIVVGPREMFRGFIDDWNLKQPDIDITFANSFIHWNKKVLRKPGPTCAWPFKSTECAYGGGETWCNQSYVRCVQLANTDNFGGSRFLPSLAAKKIWWGRASV